MTWLLSIGITIISIIVLTAIVWLLIYLDYEFDIPAVEILIAILIFIILVISVHNLIF